jgi:hypothetical protein
MGFYELRAAMEPPPLVMMPNKVVGGEEAFPAHPWDMWSFGSFVTKDKTRELHGQNNEFAHSRINLKELVEKMFLEEHTTQQMEDVWELGQMEELCGVVGLEEVEPSSPGIQYQPRVEKAVPKECKEVVTKDTWKPVVGLEDGAE